MRMVKVPVQKEPEKNSLIVEGGAGMGLASCDPAGMFAVRTHDPVSYTHLRAHETVLDLVCRLLLEKKK